MLIKTKIHRHEAILILALKENITTTEARKKLSKIVKYSFPKENGDQTNINNYYENNSKKFVYNFFKKLSFYTINEKKRNTNELQCFVDLNNKDIINLKRIRIMTTVNKNVFDSKNSFKIALNKIKKRYPKIDTSNINREIKTGKKNTAGNLAVNINGKTFIFNYNRFIYEDFFNNEKIKSIQEIEKMIEKKYYDIPNIEILEKINPNLKKDFKKDVLKAFETPEIIQDRILDLILEISDLKKLKSIEKIISEKKY